MSDVTRLGGRNSPFYLIPIMLGMAGVLFAGQLQDHLARAAVVLVCLAIPMFVGGNLLARYSMDWVQRVVLLASMALLIVGAVYSELGYSEIFVAGEYLPDDASSVLRWVGLGSLLLGLSAFLYSVIRSQAVISALSERFQQVSEHMAEGFVLTDEDGRVVHVNSRLAEMTEIPQKEILGKDSRDIGKRLGAETLARHAMPRERGVVLEFEVSWKRQGEPHQFWITSTPIYDRRNKRVGALATVRDITERERMAAQLEDYAARLQQLVDEQTERLRLSEQRLRSLLLTMEEGFATIDTDLRIRFANEYLCTMIGQPAERLSGAQLTDYIAVPDRPRFEREVRNVAQEANPGHAYEFSLLGKDGGPIEVKVGIARVHDDRDNGASWSIVFTDVHELKTMQHQLEVRARQLEEANEELLRLDRAKDVFLTNVSHELRTPLSTVQGYVEMWEAGDLGIVEGPQGGALKVMGRNIERLTRLINEMIEFSRMEITGVRLYRSLFSPAKLAHECIDSARPDAMNKDISISAFTPEGFPEMWGDRSKLTQVLGILLSNAVKFSREGALIQVHVERRNDTGVALSVSDTGIGIAPSDQERIFGKFFQVDSSYTRHYQGTGIGLSIAQSIVEAHGGKINLTSKVDKGSTFEVLLPNVLFAGEAAAPCDNELNGARVLIASDQDEFRSSVADHLGRAGCEIDTFESGHECARAASDTEPDLVLVDEILSDVPGSELVSLLRESPLTNATPVIVFTTVDDPGDTEQQISGRIWELKKPFRSEELLLKALKACALGGEIGQAWVGNDRHEVSTHIPEVK